MASIFWMTMRCHRPVACPASTQSRRQNQDAEEEQEHGAKEDEEEGDDLSSVYADLKWSPERAHRPEPSE